VAVCVAVCAMLINHDHDVRPFLGRCRACRVQALLAAVELRAPSLASWFETLFAVLQQTAR